MRSGISLFVGKNFHLLIIPKKEDSGSSLGQARGWLSVLRSAAPKIDLVRELSPVASVCSGHT